ncbi:MAG TPA: hypothetical protein VIU10_05500, partial [Candidatus Udaeobacter sp.]
MVDGTPAGDCVAFVTGDIDGEGDPLTTCLVDFRPHPTAAKTATQSAYRRASRTCLIAGYTGIVWNMHGSLIKPAKNESRDLQKTAVSSDRFA